MKKSSLIGRLTGRLPIPVFAGIAGGVLSIFLFLAVMAISVGYRMIFLGAPLGLLVPAPVMLAMLLACMGISAAGA